MRRDQCKSTVDILRKCEGARQPGFFWRCDLDFSTDSCAGNIGVMPEALDLLSLDGRLRQRIAHSFRQNELSDLYTAVLR